jgi:NADH dehydrogenase
MTYERAVENSRTLIRAARQAGVRRIVQVSIANPSAVSPLPYYCGKAEVEKAVVESGMSYAILRPTVIFGNEDILINNIAWLVRKFPVFAIPGPGEYRLQPIFVEDFSELAVRAGLATECTVADAVGPEIYTFEELVRLVASAIGRRPRSVHLPPGLVYVACSLLSVPLRDVLLTREEIAGLMADLLVSREAPAGRTRLSDWLLKNSRTVGMRYASELARHYTL